MNWDKIINFIKDLLAPIVAYFIGRHTEKVESDNKALRERIKQEKEREEKNKRVRSKYDRIRAATNKLPKKGHIPKSEE